MDSMGRLWLDADNLYFSLSLSPSVPHSLSVFVHLACQCILIVISDPVMSHLSTRRPQTVSLPLSPPMIHHLSASMLCISSLVMYCSRYRQQIFSLPFDCLSCRSIPPSLFSYPDLYLHFLLPAVFVEIQLPAC